MNLQHIFNRIVGDGESLAIELPDRKAFDSLRVMLVRKFSSYVELCSGVGMEEYNDKYMACAWDNATRTATFKMADKSEATRKKKEYVVKSL